MRLNKNLLLSLHSAYGYIITTSLIINLWLWSTSIQNDQPFLMVMLCILIELLIIVLLILFAKSNKTLTTKVRNAEKERQVYIDSSGDGYWDWLIQEDYEYMSPRFWEMFGYLPEEKPHKPSAWQDMIFEDDLAIALDNFNKHVSTLGEHPYVQEVRYRHKNGSTVTVLCRGSVIEWDKKQQPVRMVGTHTDITELKEKTAELEKTLDFQKLLTTVNTDLIFVKDKQSRIIEANPAFLQLYPEDKRADVFNNTTVDQHDRDEAKKFLAEDQKAFDEGFSEVVETITFPIGLTRTLLTKKIRFNDINQQTFILGIARDITELKKTEAALIKVNEELEEFAYRTSHDLRSPLISSNKLLSIIISTLEKDDTKTALEYIRLIQKSLDKLDTLVTDILSITQINHAELNETIIDINAIIDESLEKMAHMDDFENLTFSKKLNHQSSIILPKEHIVLVIENLLSNAIKYQNPNESKPMVNIITEEKHNHLILTISDNGIGIPEEARDTLFTMFKRFHPKIAFGSGLGLYMVKKSISKIGGTIKYRPQDSGTEFIINLPIKSLSNETKKN